MRCSRFYAALALLLSLLVTTAPAQQILRPPGIGTVTNLTGPITSVGNATAIASQTGTGTQFVVATAPTITGGLHTAITTLGLRDTSAAFDVTITATDPATISAGRTLTLGMGNVAHTLNFGTTANTITFPNAASGTVPFLNFAQAWTALQSFGTNLGGTLQTAAQPNVTSLGTLTGLTVSGAATGSTLNLSAGIVVQGNATVGSTNVTQLEIYSAASQGFIQAFNRGLGTYQPLLLNALSIDLQIGGASKLLVNTSGNTVVGSTTGSTSKTTGSLTTGGGLGVAGALFTDTLSIITAAVTSQTNVLCYNTTTGLVTTTTQGTACLISSAKYKDHITNLSDKRALDIATQLQPISFRYKTEADMGDAMHLGFTAEQVENVEPQLVEYKNGLPHGVKYGELSAVWAGALRELRQELQELRGW